eukprot:scaffold136214_cov21-Prasinocladus_malaysianus.AAC.1
MAFNEMKSSPYILRSVQITDKGIGSVAVQAGTLRHRDSRLERTCWLKQCTEMVKRHLKHRPMACGSQT